MTKRMVNTADFSLGYDLGVLATKISWTKNEIEATKKELELLEQTLKVYEQQQEEARN